MTKILPLSEYRMTSNGIIKLNVISIKRITTLTIVILGIIGYSIYYNSDKLFPKPQIIPIVVQEKNKTLIALEQFIETTNRDLEYSEIEKYATLIQKYSLRNDIDPYLLAGLVKVESKFDRYAISSAGAIGLTQVIPFWHKEKILILSRQFGHFDIFDPEQNIALGSMILNEYKRGSSNHLKALLKYNGSLGISTKYAKLVMAEREKAYKFRRQLT